MRKKKVLLKTKKKTVSLNKYTGKWVAFVNGKVVDYNETLKGLMNKVDKKGLKKDVSVFLVPRKDEGPYVLIIL